MENFDLFSSFLFPYLNLIVFVILAYFVLRKPLVNAVVAKKDAFNILLKQANQAKEEAESKNRELQKRLKALDTEVEELKTQSVKQAEEEARAIVANAQALADHLRREAKRIADAEVAAAKHEIQAQIIKQVRELAVLEMSKNLDANRQNALTKQSLADLNRLDHHGVRE